MSEALQKISDAATRRPRLGFLGVGWIGRHRMEAILADGCAEAAAIADASPEMCEAARALAPEAEVAGSLEELLAAGVDGVVIATPSALHAEQAIAALARGVAVFCQKPLGRTAAEARVVVDAARAADRLLAVDLSYRFTAGMQAIRELAQAGELGRIYAVDLVFDTRGGDTLRRSWAVVKPGGVLVSIVSPPPPPEVVQGHAVRFVWFAVEPNRDELVQIGALIDGGQLRPIIDTVFPLAQARQAYEQATRGHTRGKIVLRVVDDGPGQGSGHGIAGDR